MTAFDPRTAADALAISVGDSFNTMAAMLQVLTDGADGGYAIAYASADYEPIDLIVDEIARDPESDDTLPFIVGRLWSDREVPTAVSLRLPIAGASIHIY